MAASLNDQDSLLPKTTNLYGELENCKADWWVSGFFPGVLWYLYEYSDDLIFKKLAHKYSMRVADQQYIKTSHDLGFIIFCSFGNGYRLTKDTSYLKIIEAASGSLMPIITL